MTIRSLLTRKRVVAAVVMVAVIAMVGSGSAVVAGTDSRAHTRGVLLFVGDSNVTLSAPQIVWQTTYFAHEQDPYIPVLASRVGATIRTPDCRIASGCTTHNYWQIKLRATLSKVYPDAIVNNLGINDALAPGTQTTPGYSYYGKKIDWFMQLIPQDTRVFWTNLPCLIEPSTLVKGCHAVNDALSEARNRWPNLLMVSWGSRANGHPEYLVHPNGEPNVHNSAVGSAQWILQIIAAIDARLPAN